MNKTSNSSSCRPYMYMDCTCRSRGWCWCGAQSWWPCTAQTQSGSSSGSTRQSEGRHQMSPHREAELLSCEEALEPSTRVDAAQRWKNGWNHHEILSFWHTNIVTKHLSASPFSPHSYSSPSGNLSTNGFKWESSRAFHKASSEFSMRGSILNRKVPENTTGSWKGKEFNTANRGSTF